MAKYSDGVTAEVGDIVKCVVPKSPIDGHWDLEGDCTYKVVRTSQSHIHVAGKVLYSNRFELIKRTGVNGVYASGEVPEAGDEVECLESHGIHNEGWQYVVHGFNIYGNVCTKDTDHGTAPKRFKLISRKEQPAVKHEQSPPLVVWPEEKKSVKFRNLESDELFVFDDGRTDQCVKQRKGAGFVVRFQQGNHFIDTGIVHLVADEFAPVRRLKMTVAPQFTVIVEQQKSELARLERIITKDTP
jgi:hypothetical protein